jgi:hypothetical protein
LVVFLSSESIDGNQTLQQLKDNPKVDIVGITALQFAANQGHEFLLSETELDLWRGDMLKTTKTSVRCLQDDTKPLIVPTKVENNIIINKPMEPIKFVNYASGGAMLSLERKTTKPLAGVTTSPSVKSWILMLLIVYFEPKSIITHPSFKYH